MRTIQWIRTIALLAVAAWPMLVAPDARAEIVGGEFSESFSLCEAVEDEGGAPRLECRAGDFRIQSDAVGSEFGFALASGHLNGDAYEDLVVGDPARNRVLVYFGRPSVTAGYGLDAATLADRAVDADAQADLVLVADAAVAGAFGFSVAIGSQAAASSCAPDDRAYPLVVGAPGRPGVGSGAPGAVFYIPGGALCGPRTDPATPTQLDPVDVGRRVRAPRVEDNDEFGYAVAFGRVLATTGEQEDVIVGARAASGGAGRVVVFPVDGGVVDTSAAAVVEIDGAEGEGLGETLAVGDLDGDFDETDDPNGAADDLAIGAVGAAGGKVVLVQGPLDADGGPDADGRYDESDSRISSLVGEVDGDYFGFSLAISDAGRLAVGAVYADNDAPNAASETDGGDPLTNVVGGDRINTGKVYVWEPTLLPADAPEASAATADRVLVGRRSADQLGFAVGYADLDASGEDDLILTARREDGRGLAVNDIDQGTAYVIFDAAEGDSPLDLGLCAINSDCTGVAGVDVMIFGGDRTGDGGDEIGYTLAAGDFNGDATTDLFVSSLARTRVYAVTLDDADDDRDDQGRNIRDDDDDNDGDPDATDCAPLDEAINSEADEIACNDVDENCNGESDDVPDDDGDGFDACGSSEAAPDCDDDDDASNPDAIEQCDGNDNTCSGTVPFDEQDLDGDGWVACADWDDVQGDNEAIVGGGDCDSSRDDTFPGSAPAEAASDACMRDADDDDYGDLDAPAGVTSGTDCDDVDAGAFPGAAELDDPTACMRDADEDGYGSASASSPVAPGQDCNDDDAQSFPGAGEVCDGNDNDCDGMAGEGETDSDGDGWVACTGWDDVQGDDPAIAGGGDCVVDDGAVFPGAASNDSESACMKDADGDDWGDVDAPAGAAPGSDCDDASAATFPGAAPNDAPLNCLRDADGDDWGDANAVLPVVAGTDCDDDDPTVFVGATDRPDDGIDQDCSGSDTVTCFEDLDGDGFGTTVELTADDGDCTDPGESELDTDCDDDDASINPGADEIADDEIDQDCSGSDSVTCFVDEDGDGGGRDGSTVTADDGTCDTDEQEASEAGDCDDADETTFAGATERCDGRDNDCDGAVPADESDGDDDGYVACDDWSGDDPAVIAGGDCDDTASTVSPGAGFNEPVSGRCMRDADGDGFGDLDPGEGVEAGTDCDDTSPDAAVTFPGAAAIGGPFNCMKDADGDDYGDATVTLPVVAGDDCDDDDPTRFAGADELCDGVDNDCDGAVPDDEGDVDGDGYVACDGWIGDASVLGGGDCDETSIETFPGAAELDSPPDACMRDADGDGYGDLTPPAGVTAGADCDDASPTAAVTFPGAAAIDGPLNCMRDADDDDYGDAGAALPIAAGDDCDDGDPAVNPGVNEGPLGSPICGDTIDNDCDGLADLDDPVCAGTSGPCPDADGDGFADCSSDPNCDGSGLACGDCDDTSAAVNPDASEVCDNADNDCDGAEDEGFDGDGDGFTVCDLPRPDCDDGDLAVNPAAIERCDDGIDNDCTATTPDLFDGDGDGATCDVDCNDADAARNLDDDDGDGFSSCTGDCDDGVATTNPAAPELCNDGVDNDCDAATADVFDADGDGDTCEADCDDDDATLNLGDVDGDTYSSCAGDCDDGDASINPDATDGCDGTDNNCDGRIDESFDTDGDGFSSCSMPPDCDDGNAQISPGLPEACNDGLDNDCNAATPDVFDGDADGASCIDDCDDTDAATRPGALELCDGNDNDCSGSVPFDEADLDGDGWVVCEPWNDGQGDQPTVLGGGDCDETSPATFPGAAPNESTPDACMRDADGDDWADAAPPSGVVPGTDCDDSLETTFPGAAEIEAPFDCMSDLDDDGYGDATAVGDVAAGTDCDDADAASFPGAVEACDGNDNDCDGAPAADETDADGDRWVDCADWDDSQGDDPTVLGGGDCAPADATTFPGAAPNESAPAACMRDADGDDYGDVDAPPGAAAGTDCDDGSSSTFPGAAPLDAPLNCMRDVDNDDYGDAAAVLPVVAGTDCDDRDASIFTGAADPPDDGIDQDCSGTDTVSCFEDLDGDGFGSSVVLNAGDGDCADAGESTVSTDCDDGDAGVNPDAAEIADDGVDQDCNGSDTVTCFVDSDGDGVGVDTEPTVAAGDGSCDAAQQEAATAGDCDDADPASFPGAAEACDGNDNDCDGALPTVETDGDGDRYVACAGWNDSQGDDATILGGGDCDDTSTTTRPGAAPREADPGACMRDADGDDYGDQTPPAGVTAGTDCDDDSPTGASTFPGAASIDAPFNCMRDVDDDGYGDSTAALPVVAGSDCDDDDAATFAGAPERCDGLDNDCDATVPGDELDGDGDRWVRCEDWSGTSPAIDGGGDCDDAAPDTFPGAASAESTPMACRRDADGDRFGDLSPPAGVTSGTDCDDTSPSTFPGAAAIDGPLNCMADADDDDYGDSSAVLPVVAGGDCDDADPAVNPGTPEGPQGAPICSDTVDNDCDGLTDIDDPVCAGLSPPCPDADGDGFADCATDPNCDFAGLTCGDCDDGSAAINPDASEICDNVDNDCDAAIDEGFDADGDGFTTCDLPRADCDDGNLAVNPAAVEQCGDGVDNDCDAATPDLFDGDGDGTTCEADCDDANPALNRADVDGDGASTCDGDCDDGEATTNPSAPELCGDGVDNDCNAATPDVFDGDGDGASCTVDCDDGDPTLNLADADMDSFTSCAGDCDDGNAAVNPGASDGCDGVDNNCDGRVDEAFDLDGDGFSSCSMPPDCDDGNALVSPGLPEACNDGLDNDCDGATPDVFDGDGDGASCIDDCDDGDPTSFPGAGEACDGNDNDCDGAIPFAETDLDGDGWVSCSPWNDTQGDNPEIAGGGDCDETSEVTFPGAAGAESTPQACRRDADGDGWGDQTPPAGVTAGNDCDDASATAAATFPGAAQIEAPLNCMRDVDDDGYGDASATLPVVPGSDCDDSRAQVSPGATEGPPGDDVCSDTLDNDCDTSIDAADPDCSAGPASRTRMRDRIRQKAQPARPQPVRPRRGARR